MVPIKTNNVWKTQKPITETSICKISVSYRVECKRYSALASTLQTANLDKKTDSDSDPFAVLIYLKKYMPIHTLECQTSHFSLYLFHYIPLLTSQEKPYSLKYCDS